MIIMAWYEVLFFFSLTEHTTEQGTHFSVIIKCLKALIHHLSNTKHMIPARTTKFLSAFAHWYVLICVLFGKHKIPYLSLHVWYVSPEFLPIIYGFKDKTSWIICCKLWNPTCILLTWYNSWTIPLPNIIKFQYSISWLSNTIWCHTYMPYLILKIFPKFIFLPIIAVFFCFPHHTVLYVGALIRFAVDRVIIYSQWLCPLPWVGTLCGPSSSRRRKCRTVRGSASYCKRQHTPWTAVNTIVTFHDCKVVWTAVKPTATCANFLATVAVALISVVSIGTLIHGRY